jgi:hypothetical protein
MLRQHLDECLRRLPNGQANGKPRGIEATTPRCIPRLAAWRMCRCQPVRPGAAAGAGADADPRLCAGVDAAAGRNGGTKIGPAVAAARCRVALYVAATPARANRPSAVGRCCRASLPLLLEMPEKPLQRLVWCFFRHIMPAGQRAAPGIGRVIALPHCKHVAVDTLGVAARPPDHQ